MAKRGAVKVLNEKRKREYNKYWDWTWQDQFRWCRPRAYAKSLREKLNKVTVNDKKQQLRIEIAKSFLRIAEEGLSQNVQGQSYEVWDTLLTALGLTQEHKRLLTELSDSTGERNEWDQFVIDWTAIREGNGLILCGTKTMKVRWEVLHRWIAYILNNKDAEE